MSFISRYRVVIVSLILVGFLIILSVVSGQNQKQYTFESTDMKSIVSGESDSDKKTNMFALGDSSAPVKIIQYSDFLCPSCSQVSLEIMPDIVKKYVDTGKAYLEFRTMAFIAAGSQISAEGAYCAADQDKFWNYHDQAYKAVWDGYFSKGVSPYSVDLYSNEGVKKIAKAAEVDQIKFDDCLDSRATKQAVTSATKSYQDSGVSGTPYIVINGIPISGVPTYEIIEATIKANL